MIGRSVNPCSSSVTGTTPRARAITVSRRVTITAALTTSRRADDGDVSLPPERRQQVAELHANENEYEAADEEGDRLPSFARAQTRAADRTRGEIRDR